MCAYLALNPLTLMVAKRQAITNSTIYDSRNFFSVIDIEIVFVIFSSFFGKRKSKGISIQCDRSDIFFAPISFSLLNCLAGCASLYDDLVNFHKVGCLLWPNKFDIHSVVSWS